MSLSALAWVGLGGMTGAILRFLVMSGMARVAPGFPYGLLLVNLLGCFAIGLLTGYIEARDLLSVEAQRFLIIGVLGSLTTYSTFGVETAHLFRLQHFAAAALLITTHLIGGLAAVFAGLSLANATT